jgi:hypothetical protein
LQRVPRQERQSPCSCTSHADVAQATRARTAREACIRIVLPSASHKKTRTDAVFGVSWILSGGPEQLRSALSLPIPHASYLPFLATLLSPKLLRDDRASAAPLRPRSLATLSPSLSFPLPDALSCPIAPSSPFQPPSLNPWAGHDAEPPAEPGSGHIG